MCVSLDEPEPIDCVLMFLSGYDKLEYSWVKVTAVSVHLRILFVTLQNTNRPLTTGPGGFNHILVAVDKFIKWIKYKPIVKISSDRAVDFISDIIYRFGFPHTIITDLGSNLTSQSF